MPTFCRHNRFIERCPICSKTLPGNEPAGTPTRRARGAGSSAGRARTQDTARRTRGDGLRVRREGRAVEDGYRSELAPGLRATADAERLAAEIDFSSARLAGISLDPPGVYGRARELAGAGDLERATWVCFLLAYVSPSEDEDDPFATIEEALAVAPLLGDVSDELGELLDAVPAPAPRSSHAAGSGIRTLSAYAQWVERSGGSQATAFAGDPEWTPQRRFARLFERLSLPGLTRSARYELLIVLGRLGLYETAADSLQLTGRGGGEDDTTLAAKRVFGIGDPMLLDRRAATLAEAAGVPLEALDLALFNWASPRRATLGFGHLPTSDGLAPAAALGV